MLQIGSRTPKDTYYIHVYIHKDNISSNDNNEDTCAYKTARLLWFPGAVKGASFLGFLYPVTAFWDNAYKGNSED